MGTLGILERKFKNRSDEKSEKFLGFVDCRHKVFNCILALNGNDRGMKVCRLYLGQTHQNLENL